MTLAPGSAKALPGRRPRRAALLCVNIDLSQPFPATESRVDVKVTKLALRMA
jgi:hypothetical protein